MKKERDTERQRMFQKVRQRDRRKKKSAGCKKTGVDKAGQKKRKKAMAGY